MGGDLPGPMKLDVHAHYLPNFYRDALMAHGHAEPDCVFYVPEWSSEEHLAVKDRLGIARSMLSVSSPGVRIASWTSRQRSTTPAARRCSTTRTGSASWPPAA
jgi:hypothetical protein